MLLRELTRSPCFSRSFGLTREGIHAEIHDWAIRYELLSDALDELEKLPPLSALWVRRRREASIGSLPTCWMTWRDF